MQYSQEHLKTMVYAEFGGQTECIMGNSKIENKEYKDICWFATFTHPARHTIKITLHDVQFVHLWRRPKSQRKEHLINCNCSKILVTQVIYQKEWGLRTTPTGKSFHSAPMTNLTMQPNTETRPVEKLSGNQPNFYLSLFCLLLGPVYMEWGTPV